VTADLGRGGSGLFVGDGVVPDGVGLLCYVSNLIPEELAGALGLSAAAANEWQVQHALLKRLKEIVRR
jgi:hypothetical protein